MQGGSDGGFIRTVVRRDNHRLVGVQAVGSHVSELSGEFVSVLEMGGVLEDVAGMIHVHPTLSEAVHEAALRALGHPLHDCCGMTSTYGRTKSKNRCAS